jgi:hypothetical protein
MVTFFANPFQMPMSQPKWITFVFVLLFAIQSKAFEILTNSQSGRIQIGAIRLDDRIPKNVQTNMTMDFQQLKMIHGRSSSKLYKSYFGDGPLSGQALFSRLEKYAKNIIYIKKSAGYLEAGGEDLVFLTPQYVQESNNLPVVYNLSAWLHESRHNEQGSESSHVDCPTGAYRTFVMRLPLADEDGLDACD